MLGMDQLAYWELTGDEQSIIEAFAASLTPKGSLSRSFNLVKTFVAAIKPELGSTIAGNVVLDSFQRPNEEPLSNEGRWSPLEPKRTPSGKIEEESLTGQGTYYWNVQEYTHPTVTVEIHRLPSEENWEFELAACISSLGETWKGYQWLFRQEATLGKFSVLLYRKGSPEKNLGAKAGVAVAVGDLIRLTVQGGEVEGWHKKGAGSWEELVHAADSTYTKGYVGVLGSNGGAVEGQLRNFEVEPVAPVKVLLRNIFKAFPAKLEPKAAFKKAFTFAKALAATLEPKATITKAFKIAKTLTAALTPTGAIVKAFSIAKTLVAKLTFSGFLKEAGKFLQTLTAKLEFAGTTSKTFSIAKTLTAKLEPTGLLVKAFAFTRTFPAKLEFVGSLPRRTTKALPAKLEFSGLVKRVRLFVIVKNLTATLFGTLLDSFQRANENPLSNGGQWETLEAGSPPTGQIKEESWFTEAFEGAYWTPKKFIEPFVSIELHSLINQLGPEIFLLAGRLNANPSGFTEEVRLKVEEEGVEGANVCYFRLEQGISGSSVTGITLAVGDRIGLSLENVQFEAERNNVAIARSWHKVGNGAWKEIGHRNIVGLEAEEAGYVGFKGTFDSGHPIRLRNFEVRELQNTHLNRLTSRGLIASLTPKGAISKTFKIAKALVATLSPTGLLVKAFAFSRTFTAKLEPVASFTKAFDFVKTFAASLTPKGSLSRLFNLVKTFVAALTFQGALSRVFNLVKTVTAKLEFAGSLPRNIFKTLVAATLGFQGSVSKAFTFTRTFTASLQPKGTLTKAFTFAKTFVASLTPTGLLVKAGDITKVFTAALTFSGSLLEEGLRKFKTLTASLTPTGLLQRNTIRNLTAKLEPIGAFARSFAISKALTAKVEFAGKLPRNIVRTLKAQLEPKGTLLKAFAFTKVFVAKLVPSGNLVKVFTFIRTFTAKLEPQGALTKSLSIIKVFSAKLEPKATFAKAFNFAKVLTAKLTSSGALGRRTFKALTASLTFAGQLRSRAQKVLTATLTFAGSVPRSVVRNLQGTLTFVGAHGFSYLKVMRAGLEFSGHAARDIVKILQATLRFAGNLPRTTLKQLRASLSFKGKVFPMPPPIKRIGQGGRAILGSIVRVASRGSVRRSTPEENTPRVDSAGSISRTGQPDRPTKITED